MKRQCFLEPVSEDEVGEVFLSLKNTKCAISMLSVSILKRSRSISKYPFSVIVLYPSWFCGQRRVVMRCVMWLAVCLTQVRSHVKTRHFLFYPSLESLSTALLSLSCCSTVYTAGALTSLCEVGGWQSTQGVFRLMAPQPLAVLCRWLRHIILWGPIMVIICGTTSTN